MEKEIKKDVVVNACCPYCNQSFLQQNKKIRNDFRRKSGRIGIVYSSIIIGNYNKHIHLAKDDVPLEDGELVEFFCQHCQTSLQYRFNENLFEMIAITDKGERLMVCRSSKYKKEFTAIIKDEHIYYYGIRTPDEQKELQEFYEKKELHYSSGGTFIP